MSRKMIVAAAAVLTLLMAACGNSHRMSPEQMQHKLDSIARLENIERLQAQGISLERETSPVRAFYDSLNLQPLPLRYSESYLKYLPGYKPVPQELITYLALEGRVEPKAIALPEAVGARLVLLAADEGDGLYSLWLYSLGEDYLPVDKICLYAITPEDESENIKTLPEDQLIQDFVLTSDYEIRLTDYSGKFKPEADRIYHIDPSRHFVEDEEIDY